jgi:hypothetical protein
VAHQKFTDVNVQLSLSIVRYTGSRTSYAPPLAPEDYPNPAVVNHYSTEGLPFVTFSRDV